MKPIKKYFPFLMMIVRLKTSINDTKTDIYSTYYIGGPLQIVMNFLIEEVKDKIEMFWISSRVFTKIIPSYKDINEFLEIPIEVLEKLVLKVTEKGTINILANTSSFEIISSLNDSFGKIELFFTWSDSGYNLEEIETIKIFEDVIYDKNNFSYKKLKLFAVYLFEKKPYYFKFSIELNQQPVRSDNIIVSFKREKFVSKINIAMLKYIELIIQKTDSITYVTENGYIDLSGFFNNYKKNELTVLWAEINTSETKIRFWVKAEAKSMGKNTYIELKLVELKSVNENKPVFCTIKSPKTESSNFCERKHIMIFFLFMGLIVVCSVLIKRTKSKPKSIKSVRIKSKVSNSFTRTNIYSVKTS